MITLLALSSFVLGCSQQYLLGVPDQIALSCGVDLSQIGLLMTSFALCNAIGSPLVVIACGRKTRTIQLCVALIFMIVGLAMMALSSSYPVLLAARGICGIGYGTFIAVSTAVAADVAPEGKSGAYMSRVALGFSAATVLALPIARALHDVVDWHVAYGVLALCAVVSLLVIYRTFPKEGGGNAAASLRDRLAPLRDWRITVTLMVTCLIIACYGTAYTYITPYIDAVMPNLSSSGAGAVLLVIGLFSLLGTKISGRLCDTIGVRKTLVITLAVEVVSLGLCGTLVHSGPVIAVLLCVWTTAAWMYTPAQNLALAHMAQPNSSMALALANSFFQLGYAIGSTVAGAGVATIGVTGLPGIASIFALAALLCELFLLAKVPSGSRTRITK